MTDDHQGTTDVRNVADTPPAPAPPVDRPPTVVHFEQAVYGSFAFRDQGYEVLAQSPGCRPEWLADFRAACQKLGERPAGATDAPGLFALRLPSGPWAVVGVSPQGCDDRGRPGALAFHGLFLSPRDYRRAGADPFTLAPLLRSDWSAETRELPAGSLTVEAAPEGSPAPETPAAAVVAAITRGRRVALESPTPIDDLARQVWRGLPERVRARASVATWAFGNANRFDLLAVPRLAGVALDASYVDPQAPPVGAPAWLSRALVVAGATVFLGAAAVGLALRDEEDREETSEVPTNPAAVRVETVSAPPALPPPAPRDGNDEAPGENQRVAEALATLADRFGVKGVAANGSEPDTARMMERIARELRYRGPLLSDAERERLRNSPDRDAALALRWDALVRRFADDRPLPDGFRRRSLRGRVEAFAWSFHCEATFDPVEPGGPRRAASEAVQALGEALAVDVSVRPTLLTGRHQTLASYLTFLGRLPRR